MVKSKLAGERAIQAVGVPHLILRTSWVYSNRGKNFLLTILRLAKERDELKVIDDQIGAPTWARTIAQATASVLGKLPHPKGKEVDMFGVYHLTSAGHTSWCGFARAIVAQAATAGLGPVPVLEPIPTEAYPLPATRPRNSLLSNEKLQRTFGVALPPWEDSLSLCLQEFR